MNDWPYKTDTSAWYIKSVALVRFEDCPIYQAYMGLWFYSDINPTSAKWMATHGKDWILALPYSYSILTARYYGYGTR